MNYIELNQRISVARTLEELQSLLPIIEKLSDPQDRRDLSAAYAFKLGRLTRDK